MNPTAPSHQLAPRAAMLTCRSPLTCRLVALLALLLASCAVPPTNEKFDPGIPTSVTWTDASAITLPLERITSDGRLMFIAVELPVNGEREVFMVDSGSNITWFTNEFADRIRPRSAVIASRKATIRGVGGVRRQDTLLFDSIDLGFARAGPVLAAIGDTLAAINRTLVNRKARPLAGVIGLNLLVPLGATVDLRSSTIIFHKPSPPLR